jgi:CRISPR/Cas system endoribonuclease Cas6 (RAMP superfamily)
MNLNEYVSEALVRERHRELMLEARRIRVARAAAPRRRLRAALGAALIRLGARLLRDEPAHLPA